MIVAFAALAGVLALPTFLEGAHFAATGFLVIVSAPALAFVVGVQWCRWLVSMCAILASIFWALLPAMQHAIDRTLGFWISWIAGVGFLVATLWAACSSAIKPPNKAPEPTP